VEQENNCYKENYIANNTKQEDNMEQEKTVYKENYIVITQNNKITWNEKKKITYIKIFLLFGL
jgi:hypothetical protein